MRSMQKMWEDYAKEVQVLRERIAELREVLQRDKTMAPLERQELEARKRLLSEEVRDMERSMADIAQLLGVNISTVSRTHRRACAAVQKRLKACGLL